MKSDQVALNGSLLIRPAAVSRACEPEPAWSPMCRVTWETSVVLAWLPELAPDEAVVLPAVAEEQPAAMSASRARAAAVRSFLIMIILPSRTTPSSVSRRLRRSASSGWSRSRGRGTSMRSL